jgi:hypothetical protein
VKYTPTPITCENEGVMDYARRLDRERIEHVAAKCGLGDCGGQPVARILGKILDEVTEHLKFGSRISTKGDSQ